MKASMRHDYTDSRDRRIRLIRDVSFHCEYSWRNLLLTRKSQSLTVKLREFDEGLDGPLVKMRMISILQAQETMERGVSERDNPSTFLA
jgi:hypothetical protein